jgi:hypothetical protein
MYRRTADESMGPPPPPPPPPPLSLDAAAGFSKPTLKAQRLALLISEGKDPRVKAREAIHECMKYALALFQQHEGLDLEIFHVLVRQIKEQRNQIQACSDLLSKKQFRAQFCDVEKLSKEFLTKFTRENVERLMKKLEQRFDTLKDALYLTSGPAGWKYHSQISMDDIDDVFATSFAAPRCSSAERTYQRLNLSKTLERSWVPFYTSMKTIINPSAEPNEEIQKQMVERLNMIEGIENIIQVLLWVGIWRDSFIWTDRV